MLVVLLFQVRVGAQPSTNRKDKRAVHARAVFYSVLQVPAAIAAASDTPRCVRKVVASDSS